MGDVDDGQGAEEQQWGRWGVSWGSKERVAKGRTGADGPVVPAGCYLCLPLLHISFKKKNLFLGRYGTAWPKDVGG